MWAVSSFFLYNFFLPEAEFNHFLKEIVLVMRNCCITMSEIELVFRRAQFRCSGSLYSVIAGFAHNEFRTYRFAQNENGFAQNNKGFAHK